MGQPARFTEEQLRELDTAAGLIVQAVEDDVDNPVASPFTERAHQAARQRHNEGEVIAALEDGLDTVVEELDKYAIAYQQARENERRTDAQLAKVEHELELREGELIAANRELERWRHGVTVEGDFVCPHELRVAELEAVVEDGGERATDVVLELGRAKERIAELEALIAGGDRFAIEGARAALAGSKRAPMATPNQRKPAAGEVLPPEQRATWARKRTEHDS